MEGQIAGRTVTLYNECGSSGGGEMRKISHLLTVCEWVSERQKQQQLRASTLTSQRTLWEMSRPCVFGKNWQQENRTKANANTTTTTTSTLHTYKHAYVQYSINTYTHAHTYVLCTHSPHKPFPSISLQFFKKLTPLTIVAKQQEQQQQQRHRWLRRRRCDVDASHSQKVRASTGKRQRCIVVEDDFNVFTKSKLDALL